MAESDKPTYEELAAENARLKAEVHDQPKRAARGGRTGQGWKALGLGLLIALGCVGLVVANLGLWANRNLVSQDGYQRIATEIIKQPPVQATLVKAANTEFTSRVDVPAVVKDVLPERAAFLAGPISDQILNGVQAGLQKIVSGPKFQQVWVNVNSRAHARMVSTLENYQGNGQIDLQDVYKYLGQQLAGTPLAAVANTSLPPKFGSITVIDASWLPAVQQAYRTITWAPVVGITLAVVAFAVALWWSGRRRRTLIALTVAGALSMVVASVAVRVVRELRLDQYHDTTYRAGAEAVWQVVLTPLFTQTQLWVAVLAIVLVGAWVTGPYRAAQSLRRGFSGAAERTAQATGNLGANSPAVQWLRKRRRAVEWVLLGLDLAVLAFLTPLTLAIVMWAVAILVALVALLEILTSSKQKVAAGDGN